MKTLHHFHSMEENYDLEENEISLRNQKKMKIDKHEKYKLNHLIDKNTEHFK